MTPFVPRAATPADVPAIARIYGHYVRTTAYTFEDEAPSDEEMAARMGRILEGGFPYFVAADDSGVLGYAYAGPFRARSAYRFTVENSVYIAPGQTRRGLGTALMTALIAACRARGFCQMIALIGDAENIASVRLHEGLGFRLIGRMQAVGFKLGRWVDVTEMQLALAPP